MRRRDVQGLKTRIPPPLYAGVTAGLMWWLDRELPLARFIDVPWNRLGWAPIVLGLGIDAYAVMGFFKAATTVNPTRVTGTTHLVTTGIYRWSRNPMYGGLFIVLIGWGLVLGSITPFLGLVLFGQLFVVMQIEPEETALEAKFGPMYRDYRRRVHRWIGWPRL